ncbi:MAG: glycosyltransferase [Gallionella sp.]|nr:glycosyltransferase [Gallionella sp.]
MKISLVTISFNQAPFLERAIRSVLEQDYDDVEYIIVDPGSTDGSRGIIEKYRSRISKIIYEPDRGPADGLNIGFSNAHGEIFGFLNSDDILLPGALRYVYNYFNSNHEVDVVSGHCVIIDEFDGVIRKGFSERFSLMRHAYGTVVLMQSSTFFKAAFYTKAGGFNSSNKVAWDGELFVDMAMQGAKFAIANQFLSGFRLHKESITSSAKLSEENKVYQKYIFRKIMTREWRRSDIIIHALLRVFKHFVNPRALYQRIAKGPIYGRDAK